MQRRVLGRTGLEVSLLGLGGHTYRVGEGPDCFRTPDERAALVSRLTAGGVNYFDTTWLNEVELLADSFRRAGVGRNAVVSLQFVDGVSQPNWRETLREELESRLTVMGYSSAPLFLMGIGNERPSRSEIVASVEALQRLKEEGLVRNIGLSCHQPHCFESITDTIEETDLVDYLMVKFNWKFQQASARLFPVAQHHNVGLVVMKVFCWDCGPGQWHRRVSVFEPSEDESRGTDTNSWNAAQRSWRWCVENAPCATTVPSINAMWEAEQLLAVAGAVGSEETIDTRDFPAYAQRLWDAGEMRSLAARAESADIRERALAIAEQLSTAEETQP